MKYNAQMPDPIKEEEEEGERERKRENKSVDFSSFSFDIFREIAPQPKNRTGRTLHLQTETKWRMMERVLWPRFSHRRMCKSRTLCFQRSHQRPLSK